MVSLGENIANRIRELRLKKGLTQQELSEKANLDWSTYSRIERGKNINIQINTLEKIIKALEIDYPDFFTFSDSDNIKHRILAKIHLLEDDAILQIFENILDWKQQ